MLVKDVAYARSGDKGDVVNVGVIAATRLVEIDDNHDGIYQSTETGIPFANVAVRLRVDDRGIGKSGGRFSGATQADFAAGRISDRDLLWIIVIALGIIVLALALR